MIERVAAGLSDAARGGIAWIGVALWVGRGHRRIDATDARVASVAAIASAHVASVALAHVIGRERPCRRGRRASIPCPNSGSFPSDQASSAFAGATILTWLVPDAGPVFVAAATAVALARVVVGVHYPSDVIAGAALGRSIGRFARTRLKRRV